MQTDPSNLPPLPLPQGIRSRYVDGVNGLRMHVLEAGFETRGRPCVLLLHGFPELAYSWRKVMLPLAGAGYHVIAPDQRGYGRTTGWDAEYDGDLHAFHLLGIARDALALVNAFGYRSVAAVVGHDFGSPVSAYCALTRPDVFGSVVMMSAPIPPIPALPFGTADVPSGAEPVENVIATLEQLSPRPRKHYQWYYSGRSANADMMNAPQGLHAFMRAYYHHKSADWKDNKPYRLAGRTAAELAKMPTYYIMDRDQDMAQTVAPHMPSAAEIAACTWMTEAEMRVYSSEYARTGFQGGLQWYRTRFVPEYNAGFQLFSGRTIDVPSAFIAGKSDWGVYQWPGDFEAMQTQLCTNMVGVHLLDGAGHWVQQEQPQEVSRLLVEFLEEQSRGTSR